MSASTPERRIVPRRSFGVQDSGVYQTPEREPNAIRRVSSRISAWSDRHRSSLVPWWKKGVDENEEPELQTPSPAKAPIPTMMKPSGEVYATPLPILSMIVLSITMLGEFLSANVSTPFLLFMVQGFGGMADDAEVAFWTGILVSTFFLTQFITSLLWATIAEKHGRRVVLIISLLGSAVTCLIFGTATSLKQAITIRLMQGIFAGAVGVARGSVAFITDTTNEGRAYAILSFSWGLGGVGGAIIGGAFESPATKWPAIFENIPIFVTYPYLLPCAVAALVTFTGSVLSCFLGRDGGPREGAIRLLPEKDYANPPIPEEEPSPTTPLPDETPQTGVVGAIGKKVTRKLSSYFASRVADAHQSNPPTSAVPMASPPGTRLDRTRTFSRSSRGNGSAYGYTGSYRNRLLSRTTTFPRTDSMLSSARRSYYPGTGDAGADAPDLNFAQRLLMANENAVTNIADLWVAAAMNVDNEDPFEADTDTNSDTEQDAGTLGGDLMEEPEDVTSTVPPRGRSPVSNRNPASHLPLQHQTSYTSFRTPASFAPRHLSYSQLPNIGRPSSPTVGTPTSRRFSTTVPSIFAHTGVKTPPAVLDAQQLLFRSEVMPSPGETVPVFWSDTRQSDMESAAAPPPSLASQLPVLVIIQYGALALHSTTHDQVFLSYLVSGYQSGGLNLNAGHFAQLIALMCLAQIAYQFYLYPNLGPPRGRFSHLAMFRLGSLLFIPAYLTVVLYRPLASKDNEGGVILMTALALSTAVRYCGATFSYTSISILLNYMTPPSAVGYANGIAQSIVSLARCVGPVIGGYLWSTSVQDNPGGYPLGFVVCAAVCGLFVLQSYMIR